MPPDAPLDRERLRSRVQDVLDAWVSRQIPLLEEVDPACLPVATAVQELLAGGKRLRAGFCYWGWRGAGGPDDEVAVQVAASLELFQAAALLHDDVIDDSDIRRGRPAAHRRFEALHRGEGWQGDPRRFGLAAAVLAGDMCLSWSAELLSLASTGLPAGRREAGRAVYEQMATQLMGGQYLDVLTQARPLGDDALERARRVIRFKTVKYTMEHPLHLGARLAGADAELLAVYSAYANPVGEAFQLRDDVLGVFGDPATTGKPSGDDLREGKRTVLLALAHRAATGSQRITLDSLVGSPGLDLAGVDVVREVFTSTGAVDEVEQMIARLGDQGRAALVSAPVGQPARDVLCDLVDVATRRTT